MKPAHTDRDRSARPRRALLELPVGATVDEALMRELHALSAGLPASLPRMMALLDERSAFTEFDAAHALVRHFIDERFEDLLSGDERHKRDLLIFAARHLTPADSVRLCRRLVKDPSRTVRQRAQTLLRRQVRAGGGEVALPRDKDGPWDESGFLYGLRPAQLLAHRQGSQVQADHGVPVIKNVRELRELLHIATPGQLGFLLLATDQDGYGPYLRFAIAKRDGSPRTICAPRRQLRAVQRRILDQILGKLLPHQAAHGFVPGRSTVTNAALHRGRKLLVKFDLQNFFPTLHTYRVLGFFAHLGYYVEDGRFSTDDESRAVAPVLARLTTYVHDPVGGIGFVPQGAPTSPALSNLVCRGLDARLTGLAVKLHGTYTRYADDLTFSFDDEPAGGIGRLRWWVDQICQQEGFVVKQEKFRVVRDSQRQQVTGVVVNDALRVPREERRRFRAVLHNCERHGLSSQARGRDNFEGYLRGYASYINMVHPEEGRDLLRRVAAVLAQSTAAADGKEG